MYEPDESGAVLDDVAGLHVLGASGLYAEMRGEVSDDVRLEDAVAQLRETVCQK